MARFMVVDGGNQEANDNEPEAADTPAAADSTPRAWHAAPGSVCVTFQGVTIDENVVLHARRWMRQRVSVLAGFLHVRLTHEAGAFACTARLSMREGCGPQAVSTRASSALSAVRSALDLLDTAGCMSARRTG